MDSNVHSANTKEYRPSPSPYILKSHLSRNSQLCVQDIIFDARDTCPSTAAISKVFKRRRFLSLRISCVVIKAGDTKRSKQRKRENEEIAKEEDTQREGERAARLSRRGYSGFLISAGFRRGSIELTINYWRRFRGLPAAVVKHYAFHILLCYLIPPGARALLQ